ncbi:unnamed protein product [Calypogeia fissa]
MKMAVIPRNAEGHGWLRTALGVMELSQSIIQPVPLSARKLSERAITGGGNLDGVAPVLQLLHYKDVVMKRLVRKKVRCLQDLRDLSKEDREDVLTSVGGLSKAATDDVRANDAEVSSAVKAAVERVKGGSRLGIKKFQAPQEGTYNPPAFCLCDMWIGLDKKFNVKLKVGKRSRAEPSPKIVAEADETANYNEEHMEDGDEEGEDYDSEYSDARVTRRRAIVRSGSRELQQAC